MTEQSPKYNGERIETPTDPMEQPRWHSAREEEVPEGESIDVVTVAGLRFTSMKRRGNYVYPILDPAGVTMRIESVIYWAYINYPRKKG